MCRRGEFVIRIVAVIAAFGVAWPTVAQAQDDDATGATPPPIDAQIDAEPDAAAPEIGGGEVVWPEIAEFIVAEGPVETHYEGGRFILAQSFSDRIGRGIDQTFDLDGFDKPEDQVVADPFEPVNRVIFGFNDRVDRWFLEPVSDAYQFVVPRFGRDRIRDFIDNLKTPIWFANEVFQGDWEGAGVQAARFSLNTTIGLAGFYDVAANHAGLVKRDEDFGQTMGRWGVGNGPYLMLPFLGPTTTRDLGGTLMDTALNPLTWAQFEGETAFTVSRQAGDIVDIRYRTDPAVELLRDSIDPYAQARATYIQVRRAKVIEGIEDVGQFDDLPDFEFDE